MVTGNFTNYFSSNMMQSQSKHQHRLDVPAATKSPLREPSDSESIETAENENVNMSNLTLTLPRLSQLQKPVYSNSFKSQQATPLIADCSDSADSGDSLSESEECAAESWEECASEMDSLWDDIPFEEILSEMLIDTQTDEERVLSERGIYGLRHICDSLQGHIFGAEASTLSPNGVRGSKRVAIKRVEKALHAQHVTRDNADGTFDCVEEDILKEATLLKRLKGKCAHTVEFEDFFESAQHFYLVTAWVDGLTLEQFARRAWQLIDSGKLQRAHYFDTVSVVMWQLCRTLKKLHSQFACMCCMCCHELVLY